MSKSKYDTGIFRDAALVASKALMTRIFFSDYTSLAYTLITVASLEFQGLLGRIYNMVYGNYQTRKKKKKTVSTQNSVKVAYCLMCTVRSASC